MTTKLVTTMKREIEIDGVPYTVEISPNGVRIARKRMRSGREFSWHHLYEYAPLESSKATEPAK